MRAENRIAWWQRLLELAAFVTLPPTIAYCLGALGLWIHLAEIYTSNLGVSDLWFAVSLVPNAVIAGFGFRIIWYVLPIILGFAGISFAVIVWVRRHNLPKVPLIGLGVTLIPLCLLTLALWISQVGNTTSFPVPALRIVVGLLFLYALGFYLFWSGDRSTREVTKKVLSIYPRTAYTINAVVGLIALAYTVLFTYQTPLPCLVQQLVKEDVVAVNNPAVVQGRAKPPEDPSNFTGLFSPEGRLLAHSQGYWYVLDNNGLLRAIPGNDSSVMTIEESLTGSPLKEYQNGTFSGDMPKPYRFCR